MTETERRAAADMVYDALTHVDGYEMKQRYRDGAEVIKIVLLDTPENKPRRSALIKAVAASGENVKQAGEG